MIEFTTKALFFSLRLKPDIIHSHDTFALPAGWLSKLIRFSYLIYDAHELESDKNGQNIVLSKVTLLIERLCWPKIDLLITVSEEIKLWYMANFSHKNSFVVLNSPIIESNNTINYLTGNSKNYFVEKYQLDPNSIIFIYLGYLSYGRGINLCLEAFSTCNTNNHIIFIGSGDLESTIKSYSQKFPNIHLHPPVSHDSVVTMVKNAHWGICLLENVSLSDYYSLPNKIFEYSFAGLAIIASNFPSMKKMIDKYSLGLTCTPELDSLNSLLSRIHEYKKPEYKTDLYELSWDFQEKTLIQAYKELNKLN